MASIVNDFFPYDQPPILGPNMFVIQEIQKCSPIKPAKHVRAQIACSNAIIAYFILTILWYQLFSN